MIRSPNELPEGWEIRGRWILGVLLALGTVGMLMLGLVFEPPGPSGSAVTLELAEDAQAFDEALSEGWREDAVKSCGRGTRHDSGGPGIGTLQCHLLFDSALFVPGYVGLLVYFTMVLSRIGPGRRDILVHLLCGPAVAAGLFDIAENGMTVLAAVDFMEGFLTDATVADVRIASLYKWSLVALSFGVLAVMALSAVNSVRQAGAAVWPLHVAAAAAAVCSVVVGIGVAWPFYGLLAPGMLPALVALVLLSWWRFVRFPKVATRLAAQ